MNDTENMCPADRELFGDLALLCSIGIHGAYPQYHFVGNSSIWMLLSAKYLLWMFSHEMIIAAGHSALAYSVRKIVSLRPIEQMILAAAGWKIAMVKRLDPIWDIPIPYYQNKAMHQEGFPQSSNVEVPIAGLHPVGSPDPTFSLWSMPWSLVDMGPKSGYFCYAEHAHQLTPPSGRGGWPFSVSALRGLFHFTVIESRGGIILC